APAQDTVRTKLVKFTRGVAHDVPLYDPKPSPVVDEAWRRLYEFTETKIPSEQAAKMPNRTWPFLGDEENYIVALDVFHQLHCLVSCPHVTTLNLNLIYFRGRTCSDGSFNPGTNYTVLPMGHVRHCIGTIRQLLMCVSDITPIVWQWSDKWWVAELRDDVVHVCRDFEKIQDWARERFEKFPDLSVYIEDDLARGVEV
ncbi:hypothetical protein C8R44DRAFT_650216, partial [Mycena epipterygia]